MKLPYTRAMLNAALSGELTGAPVEAHPIFKVAVPNPAPASPRNSWTPEACGPIKTPTTARPAI